MYNQEKFQINIMGVKTPVFNQVCIYPIRYIGFKFEPVYIGKTSKNKGEN